MGYGGFSVTSSAARAAMRHLTGKSAFTHDADAKAGKAPKLHPTLDLNSKPRRECRDNSDNPNATPIAIFVDVTGSMGKIAYLVIDSLHKMVKVIQGKGVVEHPALLFGAIGDAESDQVPIQMGEFESSDELAEAHLSNIYIEGNGGGNLGESYDLGLWFAANQVDTDAWDKRGEKGFLFVIGDEELRTMSRGQYIQQHLGVASEDVDTQVTATKLEERWHVFCLRPGKTANFGKPGVRDTWTKYFPEERVIDVEDWKDIVPMIAGTVSVMSGRSLDDTLAAMKSTGMDTHGSSTALASVARSAVLASTGTTDLAGTGGGGTTRL